MSSVRKRVVFDTSTLVSAMLNAKSLSALSVVGALETCDVYSCQETFEELAEVIFRPKFDKYFSEGDNRQEFLELVKLSTLSAEITVTVTDCQDPKDNKFLARSVKADFLVSSDKKHLLSMHPYHGIALVSPAEFYRVISSSESGDDTPQE